MLEGTNDPAAGWTALDTQSNQAFAARYATNTYAIGNTTSYRYYRLRITANNGSTETRYSGTGLVQLSEFQLLAG